MRYDSMSECTFFFGPLQHANPQNQGYMVNSTLIIGDKGAILVDPGGTAEVGRHIASAVRRITDKPVTHVVNTHYHGDHYLGNQAFDGARIISSELCRKMVRETGEEWLKLMERLIGRALPETRPLPADIVYPEGAKAETFIHGVRLVFWVPRGSHTAGDLLLYLPDDKVLVAGDVLVNGVVLRSRMDSSRTGSVPWRKSKHWKQPTSCLDMETPLMPHKWLSSEPASPGSFPVCSQVSRAASTKSKSARCFIYPCRTTSNPPTS